MPDQVVIEEGIGDKVLQATDEVDEQLVFPPVLLHFEGQAKSKHVHYVGAYNPPTHQ